MVEWEEEGMENWAVLEMIVGEGGSFAAGAKPKLRIVTGRGLGV